MKRLSTLFLLVVYISCLLAGCTININVGNPAEDATNETAGKTLFDYIFNSWNQKTMYESRASVYIATTTTDNAISSADLAMALALGKTYETILQSKTIQDKIREKYQDVEYELTLEAIDQTEVLTVVVTGEGPEHLEDICNMAASLFCEHVAEVVQGVSCKVIDLATPAQQVGEIDFE